MRVTDFPGLVTNVDPDDVPAGAGTTQVNITSQVSGQLRVRRGYKALDFARVVDRESVPNPEYPFFQPTDIDDLTTDTGEFRYHSDGGGES